MDGTISPVTQVPAQVRADGEKGRKLWEASLGFESFLVRSLTASLSDTLAGDDEDTDATSASVRDQLPVALADSITANGGLGLAEQLYTSLRKGVVG